VQRAVLSLKRQRLDGQESKKKVPVYLKGSIKCDYIKEKCDARQRRQKPA
jgi:hypothetical protein